MTTLAQMPRGMRLRKWMAQHSITYEALGAALGCSRQVAYNLTVQETMPSQHYPKCLALGIPAELLPAPFDRPKGRPRLEPQFPALSERPQTP